MKVVMHGLEHQTVAAKRNDGVRFLRRHVAVTLGKRLEGILRLIGLAGDEANLFEACHGHSTALAGPRIRSWEKAL
jgi:hypothetical protein